MQVRITTTVVTAEYGTLSEGTILRTSDAFAKHLVEDAFAAEYMVSAEKAKPETVEPTDKKRAKTAKE